MKKYNELTERLLSLDSVPKAAHLVQGGRVFVMEALVQKVAEYELENGHQMPVGQLAELAMASAWMTPREAVVGWGITAYPYRLENDAGRLAIIHDVFNTELPVVVSSVSDAHEIMERLLVGDIVRGKGDVEYRSQPMLLRPTSDWGTWPLRPDLDVGRLEPAKHVFAQLVELRYEPGFKPLSNAEFESSKARELDCAERNGRVERYVYGRIDDAWGIVGQVARTPLDEATIARRYVAYQAALHEARLWVADREDGFIFYLLGTAACGEDMAPAEATAMGELLAFHILRGATPPEAIGKSVSWRKYTAAIGHRAFRVARIINYLRGDCGRSRLIGKSLQRHAEVFKSLAEKTGPSYVGHGAATGRRGRELIGEPRRPLGDAFGAVAGVKMA